MSTCIFVLVKSELITARHVHILKAFLMNQNACQLVFGDSLYRILNACVSLTSRLISKDVDAAYEKLLHFYASYLICI